MAKKYSSVLDMVKETTDDRGFVESFEEQLKSKQISKILFSLRCRANLSQAEVAQKMNCTQGKVSKIERSMDTDLSVKDLVNYCSAVNMRLEIGFTDLKMTMADQVKIHFFKLKSLLDAMRNMAKGDEAMENGVEKFTKEAFVAISFGLLNCVQKVLRKKEVKSPLHVSNPVNLDEISNVYEEILT